MENNNLIKDSCYLCTTPLQVLGAINLQLKKKERADIYLFDDFDNYKEIGERIKQENVFDNVYCINFYSSLKTKGTGFVRAEIFTRMMFCNSYFQSAVGNDIKYRKMYCSTSAVSKMVIANALFNRNEQMTVIRYDEGIGSYSNNEKGRKGSKLYQTAKRLLHWRDIIDEAKKIYLYQPDLITDSQMEIEKMPYMDLSDGQKKLLSNIFFGTSSDIPSIKEQIVIFDTYRGSNSPEETINRLDHLYKEIVDLSEHDNSILKSHPRSRAETEVDISKFKYKTLPIEMVYMNQDDLENKILIALNSTAVFTPKMLFNVEPRIVLLYRLVSDDPIIQKKRDDVYLKMAKMYESTDKVFIPDSIHELKKKLTEWLYTSNKKNN